LSHYGKHPLLNGKQKKTIMCFENLQLASPIVKVLYRCGYGGPTPIQALSIPIIPGGWDVVASARTGTGKTAGEADEVRYGSEVN